MAVLIPTITLELSGGSGLTAGLSAVRITWFSSLITGNIGYYVERKTEMTEWGHCGTTNQNILSYVDSKYLTPNKLYYYRVKALNNPSFGFSNPVSIQMPTKTIENFTYCNTGKYELLLDYFALRSSDLYLGLWNSNVLFGLPDTDFTSLSNFSSKFELSSNTYQGYQRLKISKTDTIIDSLESKMYLKVPVTFKTLSTWNNLGGFFISTTSDNSGKIIYIERFKSEGTATDLEPGKYLNISPKIGLK